MKKEDLDFELFYYVEPMRIIDNDPFGTIEMLFKYDKEKTEFKEFAKTCKIEDILWIIVTMFKEQYASYATFSVLISSPQQKKAMDNGVIYFNQSLKSDIKNLKSKYTKEDFFDYVEFEFVSPLDDIENVVEQSLGEKQWTKNDNKYILKSDSGIEYIEISPTKFKLKANMNKAKRFI